MKTIHYLTFAGVALSAAMMGCGSKPTPSSTTQSTVNSQYLATTEPTNALPVGDARQSAKDEEDIVLIGRIGGSMKPFVEGVAAFTIVDPKVPHCSKEEGCPTPWDYCCEQNEVKNNIATLKVVNGETKTVPEDARKLLGVKELNMVVVHGKAKRDAEGNLTVLADQIFVKE